MITKIKLFKPRGLLRVFPRGFTLTELLIVIAIIGILATVIIVSLGSSRAKARDARRKADLTEIQAAAEMYKDMRGSYRIALSDGTTYTGSNGSSSGYFNCVNGTNYLHSIGEGLESNGFFNPAPSEPLKSSSQLCQGGNYMYYTNYNYVANRYSKYCIYAHLERPNDGSDLDIYDDSSANCYRIGYTMNYCVGNGFQGASSP